jgi:hypothetical protein
MKGVGMCIKLARQNRVAEDGIALGVLLHATWRALALLLASAHRGSRRLRGSS